MRHLIYPNTLFMIAAKLNFVVLPEMEERSCRYEPIAGRCLQSSSKGKKLRTSFVKFQLLYSTTQGI